MKLKSIKYNSNEQEWGFEKINFFDLTLLVGVSGVGKTQILRSIYALKQIATGSNENGVKWEVEFETLKGNTYYWKGEFENNLGLNCVDVLTEDLIYDDNNIQFIATSHHPYIINKIPFDYWKIVTRKGGTIKTFDAKEFDMGNSHHDRFMSLINQPFYKQGIS